MRKRSFIPGLCLGVLAWGAFPPRAHAQPVTPQAQAPAEVSTPPASGSRATDAEARRHARVFFDAGVALYRQARYDEALVSFQQALAIFDSPAFVFNLARTCDRLHDVACALRRYREYRARNPKTGDIPEVERRIQALEADLKDRGVQVLSVTSTPPGAELTVNGVARGQTPWVGELPLGEHILRLTLAGFDDLESTVRVGQETEDQAFVLQRPIPPATPLAPVALAPTVPEAEIPLPTGEDAPSRGHRVSVWTYATLGAGVGALGTALVFELLSRRSERQVRDEPVQLDRVAAYDAMNQRQTVARVFAGVGAGLSALGVTLLVLDLRTPAASPSGVQARVDVRGTQIVMQGVW